MRIAMNNNPNFRAISLDNLDTVTGGYHDPAGPAGRPQPDQPTQPTGTLGARLGALLNRFADLAGQSKK